MGGIVAMRRRAERFCIIYLRRGKKSALQFEKATGGAMTHTFRTTDPRQLPEAIVLPRPNTALLKVSINDGGALAAMIV